MRSWILATAICLCACASAPEPVVLDADAHGQLTVAGFREASPFVADRLDAAVAWAVFPDVEDAERECLHEGRLFRPGASPRSAVLRCLDRPSAPAGVAYHVLVILEDPADLERLAEGGLELTDAPHLTPHDDHGQPDSLAKRWVVTSARRSLLFESWSPRQRLQLTGPAE